MKSHLFFAAGILLSARTGLADTSSRGSVSIESRNFAPDDTAATNDYGIALTTRLEVKYSSGAWNVLLGGLARLDPLDDTRNFGALEEAYGGYTAGPLRLRIGYQILNWTATEAFHPSDIINSLNFDSDLENPEKLGEPMVELRLRVLQGYLSAYYMPARIEPNLLGSSSRLSLIPAGLELGDVLWVDRDGKPSESSFAQQGAIHLSQTIGRADVALHVVHHSDRSQPTFTIDPESNVARPTYHTVTQVGLTYVQVIGSILVKIEAAHRAFRAPDAMAAPDIAAIPDHERVAAGLEYGWTTSAGHEATVIAEGQGVVADRQARKQLDVFQGDLLVGYRHFFNDVKAREILVVFISDVDTPYEYVASARYGQRISDTWSIGGSVRKLRLLGRDITSAQLTLTRSF